MSDDNNMTSQVGWMKLYGGIREWHHPEGSPILLEQSGFISCAEIEAMTPEERSILGMERMYKQCIEDKTE